MRSLGSLDDRHIIQKKNLAYLSSFAEKKKKSYTRVRLK